MREGGDMGGGAQQFYQTWLKTWTEIGSLTLVLQ